MDEPVPIALYLDADVTPKLARLLRAHGFDAISAHEMGNAGLADAEHLAYAADRGRALLTYNAKVLAPLFDSYWWSDREHVGIIASEQLPVGELLSRTLRLLNRVTAADMKSNYKNLAGFAE